MRESHRRHVSAGEDRTTLQNLHPFDVLVQFERACELVTPYAAALMASVICAGPRSTSWSNVHFIHVIAKSGLLAALVMGNGLRDLVAQSPQTLAYLLAVVLAGQRLL